ncbi:MAG: peptide deformylase, partial [Candidatus Curtissbacteria bacterium]|nr:peptide deformylase [Candidatus Curtissbacteria bacterium]
LRGENAPVKEFGKKLKQLVKDMKDTMDIAEGLGLAAPQVGINLRVFLMVLGYKSGKGKVIAMCNPRVISYSEATDIAEEGCLSLPGIWGKVERHKGVMVEFFDVEGARHVLDLKGLDAREFQHENDHLNGVLFVDRIREQSRKLSEVEIEGEVM